MARTQAVVGQEAIDFEGQTRPGVAGDPPYRSEDPRPIAEDASHVDWHQVAGLVRRGCPPALALRIVR
jgi:hypothetical protein